jgi:hypothetical protein
MGNVTILISIRMRQRGKAISEQYDGLGNRYQQWEEGMSSFSL